MSRLLQIQGGICHEEFALSGDKVFRSPLRMKMARGYSRTPSRLLRFDPIPFIILFFAIVDAECSNVGVRLKH